MWRFACVGAPPDERSAIFILDISNKRFILLFNMSVFISPSNAIDTAQAKTRQRLLDAAGEVFAEQGFHKATVREICNRAGANVAAINYHFRDKQGLYTSVLQYAHQCSVDKYPPYKGSNVRVEEQLKVFARSFLLRIFDDGRPAWHGKLMSREMIEPTTALDALVETNIRPIAQQLELLVGKYLGPEAGNQLIVLCARSIVAQCVFYHHARPVISRLYPNQQYNLEEVERLADHITRFSLGALKEFKKQLKAGKK